MLYSHYYNINKIIYDLIIFLFLLSCFFPYVRILPFNYDNQPNALIFGFFICLLNIKRKILYDFWLLLIVLFFALICVLFTSLNFNGIRIFLNYLSLFIIANATYIALLHTKGISYKLFQIVTYIWFFVGLMQRTIIPSFMEFLLFRSNNSLTLSTGRGVTSLAVEPTSYGMICILLLIINYINFKERKRYKFLCILLLIQIIGISMSSACMLIFMISIVLFLVYKIIKSKKRFFFILILIVSFGCLYVGYQYLVTCIDSRFTTLLKQALNDPSDFVLVDGSVNVRFVHAFFPIKGFLDNWGMPHGFSAYEDYINKLSSDVTYWKYLQANLFAQSRIPTAIGGSLFELGGISLLIYYVIVCNFILIRKFRPNITFYAIVFLILLLNHITYSVSIVSFFIGNLIYVSKNIQVIDFRK